MKKYLLIIFASVVFVFDGTAQCDIDGGQIDLNRQYVCQGTMVLVTSSVIPSNISSNVSYQWELNGNPISGQNQVGYCSFTTYDPNINTASVRRKVVDLTNSCSSYSNTINFIVLSGLYNGSILGNDTICNGSTSSSINSNVLPVGGDPIDGSDPGYFYGWQQSENGGNNYSDWTDISGV